MRQANIFVLGLDEENLPLLRDVPGIGDYQLHPLLHLSDWRRDDIPIVDLIDKAQQQLDAFDGPIDAELAFKVADDEQFHAAIDEIREGIGRIGQPFQQVLDMVELPPEIESVGSQVCLAEEELSGAQAAIEGYSYQGEVVVYVALDSVPFSIEFFCDPETEDVRLLEINPRHSQSHAELFQDVDGVPNHHVMLRLGLGQRPNIPGVEVHVVPSEGRLLSGLVGQDSYSYELAHVFTGADDVADMRRRYDRAVAALTFDIDGSHTNSDSHTDSGWP